MVSASPNQIDFDQPIRRWSHWASFTLFLSLIISASRDLYLLTRFPTAAGIDGYYYVIQINSLLHQRHFYFPTNTPIALYLLSGISYVTGNTILAIKLGSLSLHILLCLGIFTLIENITGKAWLGVIGALLALLSNLHLYMIADFINQLCAMAFLIWSGWCVVIAYQSKNKRWLIVALGLFIIALLSHRSAPAITLLITALMLVLHYLILHESIKSTYRILAWLLILFVWLSPFILAIQPFIELPISLRSQVLAVPHLPFARVAFAEDIILLIVAPAALFLTIRSCGQSRNDFISSFFGSIAILSLLVTLNPFLNHNTGLLGLVGRLSSLTDLQVAILVPGLIWLLNGYTGRNMSLYVVMPTLIIMIFSLATPLPAGLRPDYLAERSALVQQLPAHRERLGTSPIVIAPHGEEFVVTATLGVPSQQRMPQENNYQNVWWLLHGVNGGNLLPFSDVITVEENNAYAVFIKDSDLRHQLPFIAGDARRQLLAANPHLRETLYRSYRTK